MEMPFLARYRQVTIESAETGFLSAMISTMAFTMKVPKNRPIFTCIHLHRLALNTYADQYSIPT